MEVPACAPSHPERDQQHTGQMYNMKPVAAVEPMVPGRGNRRLRPLRRFGVLGVILTVRPSRLRSLGLSFPLQCDDHRREPVQILGTTRIIPS